MKALKTLREVEDLEAEFEVVNKNTKIEHLIPLIREYAKQVKKDFLNCLGEVVLSGTHPLWKTIYMKDVGYLTGYLTESGDICLLQAYTRKSRKYTKGGLDRFIDEVKDWKVRRMTMTWNADVPSRLFSLYGFKPSEIMYVKDIGE